MKLRYLKSIHQSRSSLLPSYCEKGKNDKGKNLEAGWLWDDIGSRYLCDYGSA